MLEQLFGSKTRIKVLRLFFRDPLESHFVRSIARDIGGQLNAVRRELELLLKLDIIVEIEEKDKKDEAKQSGKAGGSLRKYYRLNSESIIYSELQALLLKDNIIGQQEFIKALGEKTGDVKLLVLSGQFTNSTDAPTDLLIVGKVKPRSLSQLVEEYERDLGFDIRYTVMTEDEFTDRRYVMDKFLYAVFESEHVKVVNELGV